jgi:ribosomal protein L16 Arg81 hydroxylase
MPVRLCAIVSIAGTVSPLHFDPHENILAQVVGSKYVRLYSPAQSTPLYPHLEGMHKNSSQVDVEAPDLARFPLFAQAPYVECVLQAGEALFIPLRWWHYVRSLETSFSVSFWF